MAVLTIQISDDLAKRLQPYQDQIEQLLQLGLERLSFVNIMLYDEIISFLASGPTALEISNLQPSEEAQIRIRNLLDKNRAGTLSEVEAAELNQIQALNHLMTLVKIRAKKQQSQ